MAEEPRVKWHLPSHNRQCADPCGPFHWPRRPSNIGGFCDSVVDDKGCGRKHFIDPPSGIPHLVGREKVWKSSSRHVDPYQPSNERNIGKRTLELEARVENLGWTGRANNFTGPKHFVPLLTTLEPGDSTATKSYYLEKVCHQEF